MHSAVQLAIQQLDKSLEFLSKEFAGIQMGRASAGLVEGIEVETYGARQPLRNIAQIAIPDPRSIAITPWDKSVLGAIEKAIRDSNLGLSPVNDGHSIRLNIPPLTEESRKETVKVVHKMAEEAKITVRQARHDAMEKIKNDDALSEDDERREEKHLQEKVDEMNKKIEEHAKKKEHEVMTI